MSMSAKTRAIRIASVVVFCVPLSVVTYAIAEVHRAFHPAEPLGLSADVFVAWVAFFLQLIMAAFLIGRLYQVLVSVSRFIGQPVEATYAMAVAALTTISVAAIYPYAAFAVLLAISIPVWLPHGSVRAIIFWVVLALPFTFYSLLASIFLVGIPTIPMAIAMWLTVRRHVTRDPTMSARPPLSAIGQMYLAGVMVFLSMVAFVVVASDGQYPLFNVLF